MEKYKNIVIEGSIKPDVTVVMTIFNTPARKLAPALTGIIDQEYKNIGFVVIDGCSSNENKDEIYKRCLESAQKFRDKHAGLPFYADFSLERNQGHSFCRNLGLRIAHDIFKSEFVYFIDSDDEILPDSITTLMRPLNENPKIDISCGNFTQNSNEWYNKAPFDSGHGVITMSNFEAISHLCNPNGIPGCKFDEMAISLGVAWNKIFRTSLFYHYVECDNGGFKYENDIVFPNGWYNGDYFVAHKLLLKSRLVVWNSKILYFHRPGGDFKENSYQLAIAYRDRVEFLEDKFKNYGKSEKSNFVEKSILAISIFNAKLVYLWVVMDILSTKSTNFKQKIQLFTQFSDFFDKNELEIMAFRPELVGILVRFRDENK